MTHVPTLENLIHISCVPYKAVIQYGAFRIRRRRRSDTEMRHEEKMSDLDAEAVMAARGEHVRREESWVRMSRAGPDTVVCFWSSCRLHMW